MRSWIRPAVMALAGGAAALLAAGCGGSTPTPEGALPATPSVGGNQLLGPATPRPSVDPTPYPQLPGVVPPGGVASTTFGPQVTPYSYP